MNYLLSNGETVNLVGLAGTAKFLMFAYPKLDVSFVGKVPHIVMNDDVKKLYEIKKKLDANKARNMALAKARQEIIDGWYRDEFDDDIPF